MFYNFDNPDEFFVFPGTVDYKYQENTNINIGFKKTIEKAQFMIPANQPLYHLIPLTEKSVKMTTHLITPQEADKLFAGSSRMTFLGKYNHNKNIAKKKGKCPFHF